MKRKLSAHYHDLQLEEHKRKEAHWGGGAQCAMRMLSEAQVYKSCQQTLTLTILNQDSNKQDHRVMSLREEEMHKLQQEEERKQLAEEEERRWKEETMRKLAEVQRQAAEKKAREEKRVEEIAKNSAVEVLVSRDGYKLIH